MRKILLALALFFLPTFTSAQPIGIVNNATPITGGTTGQCVTRGSNGLVLLANCLAPSGAVTSFSASTTGLTPSTPSTGAVVLGGVLIGANGGTGVANTGKTITLGGNLTTTGAFNATFAIPGTGTWTFPVAGSSLAPLLSPAFTTPALGIATGTSLALGGAALDGNTLAVAGTGAFSSYISVVGGVGNNGQSPASQGMQYSGSTTVLVAGGNGAIARLSDNSGHVYIEGITGVVTLGGATAVAAPQQMTLNVQNVVAGTSNTAGANWTFAGSQSTGNAAGGSLIFRTAPAGVAGSAQNALANSFEHAYGSSTIYGTLNLRNRIDGNDSLTMRSVDGTTRGVIYVTPSYFYVQTNNLPLYLYTGTNGNVWIGSDGAATAQNQILNVQNIYAGNADTAGGSLTIKGSRGTGTGAGGSIIFQTAPAALVSGSTQNALTAALTITSTGLYQFGGTGAIYPAIARSGTTLKFRTADDLNDAPITAAAATFSGNVTSGSNILMNGGGAVYSTGNLYFGAQSVTNTNAIVNLTGSVFAYTNKNNGLVTWSSDATPYGTMDLGLSRISAGIIGVGTGAAGNIAGGLQAANLALGGASLGGTRALSVVGSSEFTQRLVITNAGDPMIEFARSGGNTFSIQHDPTQWYIYNNTTAAVALLISNARAVSMPVSLSIGGASGATLAVTGTAAISGTTTMAAFNATGTSSVIGATTIAGAATGNATATFRVFGGLSNSAGFQVTQNSTTDASLILNTAAGGTLGIGSNNAAVLTFAATTNVVAISTPLTLSNGTAAAPSVAFTADTTTGLYRISSGKIGMSLSGSRFGSFDSTGNFIFGSGSLPAGQALTSGANNFLWGNRAGGQMTTASNMIIMGLDAGLSLTTNTGVNVGAPNVYIGYTAGKNTTGGGNVAVGFVSGGGNALASTDNYSMTAVGEYALSTVSGSQKDTAFGSYALANYKRGGQMAAFGRGTGLYIQEGSYSFLAGHAAGFFSVSSVENIFIGDGAGVPNGAMVGNPPRITASQSGTVLTVTAFTAGDVPLAVGMVGVSSIAAALPANITITSFGTGTGGTGTYNVTPSQSVSSQTMQFGQATSYNIAIGTSVGSLGYVDSNNILLGNNIAMASASNMTVVGRGQTAANVSGSFAHGTTSTAINNAAGVTLTVTQIYGKTIIRSGAVAVADTTPTAAQIVAAIPGCEIGSTFDFDIINNNTGLLTITAGSGVTLSGTTTIATLFTRRYRARVTSITASSEAVTLLGVFTAAN